MAEKRVQYRLLIGKGQGLKGVYRGVEDNQSVSNNLDDWVNALLRGQINKNEVINARKYEQRLQSRLAKLYREAVNVAVNQMIGTQGNPPGSVQIDVSSLGRDALSGEDNNTFLGSAERDLRRLAPKFFRGSRLEKMFTDTKQGASLTWQPLSRKTIAAKAARMRQANGGKFPSDVKKKALRHFVDTGALRASLRSQAKTMIKRQDTVRVTGIDLRDKRGRFTSVRKKGGRKVELAKLRIRILPGITNSMLPGLASGVWSQDSGNMSFEQALGISGDNLDKLAGVGGKKRPLMQPVFTYYTLFRAPQIIAAEALDIIRSTNIKTRVGKLE